MTTTTGAISRLELLLARTPDMECADDLRVVLADAVLARAELEASESLRSATISTMRRNEAELTEARRLLEGETEAHLAVTRQLSVVESQLAEARRLLDDARVTLVGIAGATARAWELPRNEFIDEFLPWAQSRARDTAAKIAAPVPAQPAAESTCAWSENDDGFYETECGNSFQFIDGGAADNNATFCQYCGKKIDEHWFDDMPEGDAK